MWYWHWHQNVGLAAALWIKAGEGSYPSHQADKLFSSLLDCKPHRNKTGPPGANKRTEYRAAEAGRQGEGESGGRVHHIEYKQGGDIWNKQQREVGGLQVKTAGPLWKTEIWLQWRTTKHSGISQFFTLTGVESEFQELLAHNKNCKKAVIFEICSSQGPFVTALIQQCNTMNGYDTCILCLSCW